jgi:hypothetical protein
MAWAALFIFIDVLDLDDQLEPTSYGSKDFFPIFEAVFTINIAEPGWRTSTQCDFLFHTWKYFTSRVNATIITGADEGLAKLRSLFAVPVLEFNNVAYGGPQPVDLGKSISVAKTSYRV